MKSLKPQVIWDFFCQVSAIPRSSGNEQAIVTFLTDFATQRSLIYRVDAIGNLVIVKESTIGISSSRTLILQSHLDMVCEKLPNSPHNFFRDPIVPFEEKGWVMASGTTLGADNGIGVAAILALLDSKEIEHCRIEALFTIDEESGLSGAMGLQPSFVSGDVLLNLDSEEDGEFYVGCAGGIDTIGTFNAKFEQVDNKLDFALRLSITNLTGGHSGDDIGEGYSSANVILAKFLEYLRHIFQLRIVEIDGGNLRNAISRDASAVIIVHRNYKEDLRVEFNCFLAEIESEIMCFDPKVSCRLESADIPLHSFSLADSNRIINAIIELPHGVIKWSEQINSLVQSSTNFASIKQLNSTIQITTSQRSSIKNEKLEISNRVSNVFAKNGFHVIYENEYPGWESDCNSKLILQSKECYLKVFNEYPQIKEIHAGLECGILSEIYPNIEIISFGPTIRGAHSPSERIEVVSVERFWLFLKELIKSLSN